MKSHRLYMKEATGASPLRNGSIERPDSIGGGVGDLKAV